MRVTLLAAVLLVAGCRREATHEPVRSPATSGDAWVAQSSANAALGSGSATQAGSAPDPWSVEADADAPPSLADRKRHADAACPAVTAPYFYKIEKAGKVSYILGTRHVSVSLDKFPASVHDAIGSAKLVVFEVAPDDDHHSQAKDLDLPATLGAATWKHYEQLVGQDIARVAAHAPAATALVGMMVMYEDPSAQLEGEIEKVAAAAKIPMRGLETAAFQDGVLEQLLDVRMLRATIDTTADRAELEQDSRTDLAGYCAGTDDTAGMDADDRKEMMAAGYTAAELDAFDERMVFSRNADWIPKLMPMLDTGGVFVAVGAGHLQGPRSVIALLAAKGYKATRLP